MHPVKDCASCGRAFKWRKKWGANWPHVRYCSAHCRRERLDRKDEHINDTILMMLADQPAKTGVRAPQVAVHLWGSQTRADCERVLRAARRLASNSRVILRHGSHIVDATQARIHAEIHLSVPGANV